MHTGKIWGVRRCFTIALTAAVMTIAAVVPPAAAETSAREFIQPTLSHQEFTTLVRSLNLSHDQRMIIELLFTDYVDSVEATIMEADAAADEVGRQTVEDAFAGRVIIDPARLRELRASTLQAYKPYINQGDALLHDFISDVQMMLESEQRRTFDAALPELRRAQYLQPRHDTRNSYEYAGEGVDVLQLLAEARRDGGELQGLTTSDLADVSQQYATQLDALLIETSASWREAEFASRLARVTRDEPAMRQADEARIEHWQQLHQLNTHAIERIAAIATARLGESAAEIWRQRFENEAFAWLFARSTPDRQYDWLQRQRLSSQQQSEIDEIYVEYQARQRGLAREIIAMMLRARTELKCVIHPMMEQSELRGGVDRVLFEELLRKTGEMASLDSTTSGQFESVLDENQRITFRRAIRDGGSRW